MQGRVVPSLGRYVPMSTIALENGSNVSHERLASPDITITAPGYMYVYISNESTSPVEVYFDDFKVTQVHSNVVAGADYYPFGLVMSTREMTQEPWRFGYQGQYAEKDKEAGYNAFELRMYDARIGRWISGDPYGQFDSPYLGMGNNPTNGVDPSGGLFGVGWSDLKAFLFGGDWEVGRSWGWTPGVFGKIGDLNLGSGDILGVTQAVMTDAQLKRYAENNIPKEIPDDMREKIKSGNIRWHLDVKEAHTKDNKTVGVWGETEPVAAMREDTDLDVYIHPNAIKEGRKNGNIIRIVIGHEWIHITHYRSGAYAEWKRLYRGSAKAISEAKAHKWSYDQDPNDNTGLGSRNQYNKALLGWPNYSIDTDKFDYFSR